jgi:hypothetical protein
MLYLKDNFSGMYYELGRSEILRDTNNPVFYTPFLVNKSHVRIEKQTQEVVDISEVSPFEVPISEEISCLDSPVGKFLYSLVWGKQAIKEVQNKNQNLRLVIVDVDDDQYIYNKQIIGISEFSLDQILEDDGNHLGSKLHNGEKKTGIAHIIAEAVLNEKYINAQVRLRIGASGIQRKGKLYPFLVISRQINAIPGNWLPVYRSEIIDEKDPSEPYWQDIILKYLYLCNGEEQTKLKFEIFHFNTLQSLPWKFSRPHELLGSTELTLEDIMKVNTQQKTDYPMKDSVGLEIFRMHVFRYEFSEEGF